MANSFILTVQGEGRGHLSQALVVYELLQAQGHLVTAVIVGSTGSRELPTYFTDKINVPLYRIISPNFINDRNRKGIHLTKTLIHAAKSIGKFRRSLSTIKEILEAFKPDAVLNFYEVLTGVYFRLHQPRIPLISIAHQYVYFHPEFMFPSGKWLDRFFLKLYTRITTSSKAKNLGLSFYRLEDITARVKVIPPLLRRTIHNSTVERGDHLLIYLVNPGYFEEVLQWHYEHPQQIIHCFTDKAEELKYQYAYDRETVHVHAPNDTLFVEYMRTAKGLATTAGFESVCEAMYLGKPVLMVPVAGHFEQFCNSRDAVRAGAGVYASSFSLDKLEAIATISHSHHTWFKNWADASRTTLLYEIESTLNADTIKQPSANISLTEG